MLYPGWGSSISSWVFGKLAILVDTLEKHKLPIPFFYGITSRGSFPALRAVDYLSATFRTRASIVQLREKDLPEEDLRTLVQEGVSLARSTGKLFLVNSAIDLALEYKADGVHLTSTQPVKRAISLRKGLGRESFLIGKSVHSIAEAVAVETEGVDYVLLSPIFPPISKPSTFPALGWSGLREAAQMLYTPVIALGGFDDSTASEVFSAGALGGAGISWLRVEVEQLLASG